MSAGRRPPPELPAQLDGWAAATYGAAARAANVVVLPGHAGLTYGFDVVGPQGDVLDRLVLRLPPKGVRRQGSTDVLRQAPLIITLAEQGVPTAAVRAASADERYFGVPFLVVSRVAGRNVSIDSGEPPQAQHFLAAVQALGRLHAVDWADRLPNWSTPRSYHDEVLAWDRALGKASAAPWHRAAVSVRGSLIDHAPPAGRIGVTHGDYQFSNLLFDQDTLVAVLDWEISGIGPQLADFAWFLMINDQRSWAHPVAVQGRPADAVLRAAYESSATRTVSQAELGYACALAAYRFAVIAGLNLELHRSGKRVDEHWAMLEPSIPLLLKRAAEDLASAS